MTLNLNLEKYIVTEIFPKKDIPENNEYMYVGIYISMQGKVFCEYGIEILILLTAWIMEVVT